MKQAVAKNWNRLGTTGKILISITLFYLIGKLVKNH